MKIAILLLVLSMLFIAGCGTGTTPTDEISQPEDISEASQEEALDEVSGSLIPEDEEIEIGEMI